MEGAKDGKRKLIALLAALALAIWTSIWPTASDVAAAEARTGIEVNGTFAKDVTGLPAGWSTDAYIGGDDSVVFEALEAGGPDGAAYVRVVNLQPNDARWTRTVAVEPGTFYRLSALVRAEAAEGNGERESGANLSVLGVIGHSEHYVHTDGQWVPIEFIGKTGATQTEITVALRLGGYGALIAGIAEFASFELESLGTEPPAGTQWSSFYPDEPSPAVADHGSTKQDSVSAAFLFWTYAIGVLGLLLGGWYVRREDTQLTPDLSVPDRSTTTYLGIIFAAGALLRVVLSLSVKGHPIDMLDFAAWADRAYMGGLNGFFAEGLFADYPPGYIYVLYVLGALRDLLGLSADIPAAWLLLKLPAIAADIALSALIASVVLKRWGAQPAMVAATFLAFNPMTIVGSSLWGQVDSVLALLLVLYVLALTVNRTTTASLWLTVAVLVKPQAIVLAPLLFLVLLRSKSAKHWVIAAGSALAALVVLVLPFEALRDPAGLLEHYKAMFASYPYASLNAANAYGLLGLNATPNGHWIGPMTVSAWSNVLTIAIVAFAVLVERRFHATGKSAEGVPVIALLLAILVFTLRSGMHERYGFAAAILALLACAFVRSNRLRMIAAGFSLVQFANIAYVLEFGLRESYYVPVDDAFFRLLSLLEVALAGWAAYESWRIAGSAAVIKQVPVKQVSTKPAPSKKRPGPTSQKAAPVERADEIPAGERRLTRKDAILMVVLTFVGGAIGFYRLGSADAPHSVWHAEPGQYEEFSLYRTEYVADILVYAGLGNGSLELEKTMDGVTWSPALTIKGSDATVFQWQRVTAGFEASAIRARLPDTGMTATFYELSLRDSNNLSIPLETPSSSALFDEPDSVPSRPSYMNSMYFDEIYHARTAYEHANGIEAYETTHPPLGKVIMSAGISLFGMNPFGWRFMGALFGMLTIPLLYVFGKRMFGRTEYAALAGGLIALDFMRFSLSRIGTVDVFAVFFIALAAFAMYEYYRLSVIEQASLRRTLIPLAASAIAIGMAIATKWIGLYAGLGLAITLLVIWRSPRFPRGRYGPTLAWTAGLFTLGPAAVYLASYIPFLNLSGPGHGIGDVISYQKFMFNYHSGLVATHPFSSSWWQWPLIQRPVWTYAGPAENAGDVVSIVLMGNPAIWWVGSAAAVYMAIRLRSDRRFDALFLLIGLAAQLVPWMFVSRLTFIYHFYASVPFIILCTVYVIRLISERVAASRLRYGVLAYITIAVVLFAMFYPILAGADVDRDYVMQALKWYKSWILSL